jgi:hypothetical protein
MSFSENDDSAFEIRKNEKLALYCFLWIQIIHTTYFLLVSGIELFTLPFWTHSVERFGASLIVLAVLAKVRYGICRGRTWAWGFSIIIALNVLCFAGWYWRYEDQIPKIILGVQLALVPMFLFVLIRKRIAFQVTMRPAIELPLAIVISIAVVYLRSEYFATNQVNWAIDPPYYFERLVYSNFHWPQENSLALMFLATLIVRYLSGAVTRRHVETSSSYLM